MTSPFQVQQGREQLLWLTTMDYENLFGNMTIG